MKKINKLFYFSLPVLFLLGSLSHFVYEIFNFKLLGVIFPVNESIYEHTKLAIFPLIIFYIYLYFKEKTNINKLLLTFIVSLFTTIILIPMLYYFYTGSFAFESVIIDIIVYFVSITFGQLLALHVYNKSSLNIDYNILIVIIITYFIINTILTFNPPKIPIFYDNFNRLYGFK